MEDDTMPPTLMPQTAQEMLAQSSFQAIRRLRIEETENELIVSGSVSSYYLKQQAQESLLPFMGSRTLRNRIVVVLPKGRTGSDDGPKS